MYEYEARVEYQAQRTPEKVQDATTPAYAKRPNVLKDIKLLSYLLMCSRNQKSISDQTDHHHYHSVDAQRKRQVPQQSSSPVPVAVRLTCYGTLCLSTLKLVFIILVFDQPLMMCRLRI